jgi:hypothetical protein
MAYQTIIPTQLGQSLVTDAYTTLYTVPDNTRTFVKAISICNTSSTTASNIYMHLVPYGGAASTSNAIFYNNPVVSTATVQYLTSQIMNPGDTIQIKASVTNLLCVTASGGEAT